MIARAFNEDLPISLHLALVFFVGAVCWLGWKFMRELKARPALWKKMGAPDSMTDSCASFTSKVISGLLLKEPELSDLSPEEREFLRRIRWTLILTVLVNSTAVGAIVIGIAYYAR